MFITFAHLCYLKIILRLFIEGQVWVRVCVSRAVKESCEAGSMVTMVAVKLPSDYVFLKLHQLLQCCWPAVLATNRMLAKHSVTISICHDVDTMAMQ